MATVKKTAFELEGADGGPLRGDVRTAASGARRPAVVICHGFKGFKDWGMFPPLAERLARAGLTAISFNFSGSGVGPDGDSFSEPTRFKHDTYTRQLTDLATVIEATDHARLASGLSQPSRIGLFGHSRGGGVAQAVVGYTDALVETLFNQNGVPVFVQEPLEREIAKRMEQLETELARVKEESGGRTPGSG